MPFDKYTKIYECMDEIFKGYSSLLYESSSIFTTENELALAYTQFQKDEMSVIVGDSNPISDIFIDNVSIYNTERIYYKTLKTDMILAKSTDAPFGKGTETVLDPTVRKAKEIKANRLTVKYNKSIEKVLNQHAPPNAVLTSKLYKMQIYEVGGHFKPHKDTIHAPNHYATLVIAVPESKFKGGLLCVDNKKIDFNVSSYALFMTDIEHSVTLVTSGIRCVLQYDIYIEYLNMSSLPCDLIKSVEEYCEDNEKKYESDEDYYDYDCQSFYDREDIDILGKPDNTKLNKFLMLLDSYEHKKDENIVFVLAHSYPRTIQPENLRGSDKLLYNSLSKIYNIDLGFCINKMESNYDGTYIKSECNNLWCMNYDSIQYLKSFLESDDKKIIKEKKIITFISNKANFMETYSQDYQEHTGNEAAPAQYVYCSIVIALGDKL